MVIIIRFVYTVMSNNKTVLCYGSYIISTYVASL